MDPNQTAGALKATTYQYDAFGRRVTETAPVADAAGATAEAGYFYDLSGNLRKTVDFRGYAWTAVYDILNRKTSETTPGDTGAPAGTTAYTYNRFGALLQTDAPEGNTVKQRYDVAGRLVKSIDALDMETVYTYDNNNNLTAVTDPNNLTTETAYDALNRKTTVTLPDETTETLFRYDRNSRPVSTIDPMEIETRQYYNARGEVVKTREAVETSLQKDTLYSYDPLGNRTRIIDANANETTFTYDYRNRLKKHIFPDSKYYEYAYDANGNITNTRTPGGDIIRQFYDHANRLKEKSFDSAAYNYTYSYTYDANSNPDVFTTEVESIATSSTETFTTTYHHFNRNLPSSVAYSYTGMDTARTIAYTYYQDGMRKTMTTPANRTVTCSADARRMPTGINWTARGSTTPTQNVTFAYDDAGLLKTKTYEQSEAGEVVRGYTYDSNYRLIKMGVKRESDKLRLMTHEYHYNDNGYKNYEKTHFEYLSGGTQEYAHTDLFQYDDLYRVTDAKLQVKDASATTLTAGLTPGVEKTAANWPVELPFDSTYSTVTSTQSLELDC